MEVGNIEQHDDSFNLRIDANPQVKKVKTKMCIYTLIFFNNY